MRLFSNKDITGKKRLLTFKETGGLAGIELNLLRDQFKPSGITQRADLPLDQTKAWINYIYNLRYMDSDAAGTFEITDFNEMKCVNPGNTLVFAGFPLMLEPGGQYKVSLKYKGHARVYLLYNIDSIWKRESDDDKPIVEASDDFKVKDFTINVPVGDTVWTILLIGTGSRSTTEYYSVLMEKL